MTLSGTKVANTYLYINDVRIDEIEVLATEWTYVIPYLDSGVNGFKIYTVDLEGNQSASVITSVIELGTNMETIRFAKAALKEGIMYSEMPTLKNLEFKAIHGTDEEGKAIIITGILRSTTNYLKNIFQDSFYYG